MNGGKFTSCDRLICFHSDSFFGLAISDAEMNRLDKWKPANENFMTNHIIGGKNEERVEEVQIFGATQHS